MIINKPSIKIVSRPIDSKNITEEEYYKAVYNNNIERMLRAIGVCRKKDCLSKGEKFFWNWYKASIEEQPEHKKHLSVLQHGDSWSDDYDYYTLRDYYNRFNKIDTESKHTDCKRYQIEITANNHTSIQWRTHTTKYSNISFLVESTRAVDYTEEEPTVNTSEKISSKLLDAIKKTFGLYYVLRDAGIKKEQAGRCLTTYRETKMIGTATKEEWLNVCKKRIASGAQTDAEFVATLIKEALEKEE